MIPLSPMPPTFQALKAHPGFSKLKPIERLEQMLVFKDFDTLLAEGEILGAEEVAKKTGYTRQHVYRLIQGGHLECITRGANPREVTYFFLPDQVTALFSSSRPTRTRKPRGA